MPPGKDWVHEITNGKLPEDFEEFNEFEGQMKRLGMKGAYNPLNVFAGSPFTPSSNPSPEEVKKQSALHSKKILSDWIKLKNIVEKYHHVFEKRWMKKSKKKQKEILLRAWPNMSPNHRPDYEAFRAENTGSALLGLSNFQDAYKWPYINQQDLSSKSLVIFINSRARNPPSAFARADVNATRLGTVGHFIPEPAFLPMYTMFLDGDNTETYGKLVSWDEDEDAADLMFSERQFTPGDGLKAFELQERIYPFLVKCCAIILHDLVDPNSDVLPDGITPIAPEMIEGVGPSPETRPATLSEIQPSLAKISAEAPYRLPANIDFERLKAIFEARLSAAEDHILDLREDPGYFADTIDEWSQHRNDRLLDTEGNPHPTGPQTIQFWERVVRNVIVAAYTDYETWFLLHRQTSLLCTLKEKYAKDISYDKQLPKEYLIALLKLKNLVLAGCEAPMHNLQNIQSSPPLRHWFKRAPQDPNSINMYILPRNEHDPFFGKPWGLLLILWDEKKRDLFGLPGVVDAFEQLMQDPLEMQNISPYVAD